MRKNRRMLSVLLALCMVFAMLPGSVSAVAAQDAFPVLGGSPNSSPFETVDSFWSGPVLTGSSRRSAVRAETLNSSDESVPLTQLTVGDTDALTTTSGRGWRFDPDIGVLILSGTTISGTGDCAIEAVGDLTIALASGTRNAVSGDLYGIYVDGSLTIQNGYLSVETTAPDSTAIYASGDVLVTDCPSLSIQGGFEGLICEGSVDIAGSSVTISADTTIAEAEELGLGMTPCGLFAMDLLTICENSVLSATSTYSGIDAWVLDAHDSTVTGNGGFYGIYTSAAAFRNCQVNAQATVSCFPFRRSLWRSD